MQLRAVPRSSAQRGAVSPAPLVALSPRGVGSAPHCSTWNARERLHGGIGCGLLSSPGAPSSQLAGGTAVAGGAALGPEPPAAPLAAHGELLGEQLAALAASLPLELHARMIPQDRVSKGPAWW